MIRPEQYEMSSHISQSDLKLMRSNIQEFYKRKIMAIAKTKEEVEADRKKYFDVGDLTDVMFLQPQFKSEFYCMPNVQLGEKFKLLMDKLYAIVENEVKEINEKATVLETISPDVKKYLHHVEEAAKAALYYYNPEKDKPWSRNLETISNEVVTAGAPYFEALALAFGKRVVNLQDWTNAARCVEKIENSNNRQVNAIFNLVKDSQLGRLDDGIEVFLGWAFYGEINGVKVKVLVDIAIVDHNIETIRIVDLKTTKSILQFPGSYKSFGYGKQVVLYSEVVGQNYKGYKILAPGFVVVGTNPDTDDRAEYFELTEKEYAIQLNGGVYQSGTHTSSITDDLVTYQWHVSKNEWSRYPQHATENDTFLLETSGIAEVLVQPEQEEIF